MLQNEDVKQMVYDQWLVCDLLEIGFGCLPDNLVHKEKYMLKGSYCLQVCKTNYYQVFTIISLFLTIFDFLCADVYTIIILF